MSRLENEIQHAKKIIRNPEGTWGWSSPIGKIRAQRRANYILQWGRFSPLDHLLEIGCGTGLFTEKIFRQTQAQIIAMDISEDLLAIARKRKGVEGVAFQVGNAMKSGFEDNHFDGVYGNSVLHHLEIESALREMFRVLKQGGRLVFAEPNMCNPQTLIQKNIPFVKRLVGDSPDETAIVRWKLLKIMRKIGFKNIILFPFDFLHPLTPSFLIGTLQKLGEFLEKVPVFREIAGSIMIYGEKG